MRHDHHFHPIKARILFDIVDLDLSIAQWIFGNLLLGWVFDADDEALDPGVELLLDLGPVFCRADVLALEYLQIVRDA